MRNDDRVERRSRPRRTDVQKAVIQSFDLAVLHTLPFNGFRREEA